MSRIAAATGVMKMRMRDAVRAFGVPRWNNALIAGELDLALGNA